MPEQLKPGAFRLWNEKEKCYIDTDGTIHDSPEALAAAAKAVSQ